MVYIESVGKVEFPVHTSTYNHVSFTFCGHEDMGFSLVAWCKRQVHMMATVASHMAHIAIESLNYVMLLKIDEYTRLRFKLQRVYTLLR